MIPPFPFDLDNKGYRSRQDYIVELYGKGTGIVTAGGNLLESQGTKLTFRVGDSSAPEVLRVHVEQDTATSPVIASFEFNDGQAQLAQGSGSVFLHEVSTGSVVKDLNIETAGQAVSLTPGQMHVAFEANGIPAETVLSVRWTAGVAVDDFSNGISAWPRLFNNLDTPDDANKFKFTSAAAARPPPPPPFDFEISGICADPVIEEMLYAQFEKLASWDVNLAEWVPRLVILPPPSLLLSMTHYYYRPPE